MIKFNLLWSNMCKCCFFKKLQILLRETYNIILVSHEITILSSFYFS